MKICQEFSGEDFTAEDFYTWTGTVLAALALREMEAFDGETQAKKCCAGHRKCGRQF